MFFSSFIGPDTQTNPPVGGVWTEMITCYQAKRRSAQRKRLTGHFVSAGSIDHQRLCRVPDHHDHGVGGLSGWSSFTQTQRA